MSYIKELDEAFVAHTYKRFPTEIVSGKGSLLTDADGRCSFRGFFGDYDVEITAGGKTESKSLSLSKNKNNEFILVQ